MADPRGRAVACDEACGCPCPFPGGLACRCYTSRGSGVSGVDDAEEGMEHNRCSCGEHCGCNPCTCSKTDQITSGRAFCKCGDGCTCVTCVS